MALRPRLSLSTPTLLRLSHFKPQGGGVSGTEEILISKYIHQGRRDHIGQADYTVVLLCLIVFQALMGRLMTPEICKIGGGGRQREIGCR